MTHYDSRKVAEARDERLSRLLRLLKKRDTPREERLQEAERWLNEKVLLSRGEKGKE